MTTERRPCPTLGCTNEAIPSGRWCDRCTASVWHTGRPPELLPTAVRPAWLKRGNAKEMTGAAA